MYFKNDSEFQCGLRTRREILTIKAGEVVNILDCDIIELNPVLKEITEEEYNKAKKSAEKEKTDVATDAIKETDEVKEVAPQPVTVSEDELKNEPEKEVKEEKPSELSNLEKLEAKLEELKQKWQEADKPNKKAQIQKKIKEVQEEINKVK